MSTGQSSSNISQHSRRFEWEDFSRFCDICLDFALKNRMLSIELATSVSSIYLSLSRPHLVVPSMSRSYREKPCILIWLSARSHFRHLAMYEASYLEFRGCLDNRSLPKICRLQHSFALFGALSESSE